MLYRSALPLCLFAVGCGDELPGFRVVDQDGAVDADGGSDADPLDGGSDAPDASTDAPADGGPPAPDLSPCASAWTLGGCAGRSITVLVGGLVQVDGLALANATADGLAVAWGERLFADQGNLHVRLVERGSASPLGARDIEGYLGEVPGLRVALAWGREGLLHVVHWMRADDGNRILVRGWDTRAGGTDFGTPETAWSGLSWSGEVAASARPDGTLDVVSHDDASALTRHRARADDGTWSETLSSWSDLDATTPGAGAVAVTSLAERPLACHGSGFSATVARPLCHGWDEASHRLTEASTTADAPTGDAIAGLGLSLASLGEERALTHLRATTTRTDLRLVRWSGEDIDGARATTLAELPVPTDPGALPATAVALDAWGRWHVAFADAAAGTVRYLHAADGGPDPRVHEETIDAGLGDAEAARVVLVVDTDGLPHVVWFAPATGELRYATIRGE